MSEVLVWLLISTPVSSTNYRAYAPAATIAQFSNVQECERVRKVVFEDSFVVVGRCVQARVLK